MSSPPVRRTGIWLFVALSFAASAVFVLWRFLGPSDGAPVPFYAGAWSAAGVAVTPEQSASTALQPGDVVLAIEGSSVSSWIASSIDPNVPRKPAAPGTVLTYTVARDGQVVDVPVTLAQQNGWSAVRDNWSNIAFAGTLLAVALYVLLRRPELSAAVALALAATGAGSSTLPWLLGYELSDVYFGWPFLLQSLTVIGVYMLLWPAGALHLTLAIARPGGRLPLPSRPVLALIYGVPLGIYAAGLLFGLVSSPNLTAWLGTWASLQALIVIPCIVTGLTLAVIAYVDADHRAQRQIRWALIGAGSATVVGVTLLFIPQLLIGQPLLSWSVVGLFALPLPIGLAIGIVRSGLFDIEVVVNRTLVYGGVTVAIVAIYTLTVLILGAVVPQSGGFAASLVATGLAAIAALPVRDALQRGVNRLMYGDRDEPYRALARLASRLESTIEPLAIPSVVVDSVAEALHLPYVALEIGPPGEVEMTVNRGTPIADQRVIPLVYGAETVGRLLLAPRAPGESFSESDTRLLDDLARSAGAAVHSVRLTLDIVRARERLVAAREEERRRIRRDLHDGLGPTLAGIGMRAELAADQAARDPTAAEQTLQQLTGEVKSALGEIRRLVDGLRPPSLDERGLVGAIQAQAERLGPLPAFNIAATGTLPELPAAVEVAAYRIAVEAMTNAARHAGAHECRVALVVTDDALPTLSVEITDDGAGIPADVKPGIGLASMRERAAEVGGSIDFRRREGGGTTITAHLPLTPAVAQ